jgi:hypothetical protein
MMSRSMPRIFAAGLAISWIGNTLASGSNRVFGSKNGWQPNWNRIRESPRTPNWDL